MAHICNATGHYTRTRANWTNTLKVDVKLAPFASCQDSDANITGMKPILYHNNATMTVRMVARDTDGHPIARTHCEFNVFLVYEESAPPVELVVVREIDDPSQYYAVVPAASLDKQGSYRLEVQMLSAWNVSAWNVSARCTPQKWKHAVFRVSCAPMGTESASRKI